MSISVKPSNLSENISFSQLGLLQAKRRTSSMIRTEFVAKVRSASFLTYAERTLSLFFIQLGHLALETVFLAYRRIVVSCISEWYNFILRVP